MQSAGGGSPTAAAPVRPRQRVQSWLFTLAFVGLLLGTVAGFVLARGKAIDDVEQAADAAARRAAVALETDFREQMTGLSGAASVIGAAGILDEDTFHAFADGLQTAGEVTGLTLVGREPGDADVPYPVVAVGPAESGADAADVGTDFGADPVLAAALRRATTTQAPVMSRVVELVGPGGPGVELVRPLVDRSGAEPEVRGFVASAVSVDELGRIVSEAVGTGPDVSLFDGDQLMLGPPADRRIETRSTTTKLTDRDWRVVVGPVDDPDMTVAWMAAAGGMVATIAMATLMIATVRHQRRLGRANALLARSEERSRAVQEVAGRLARALSGGEVVTALVDHLPAAVGARSAVIATINEGGKLEMLGPDVSSEERRPRIFGGDVSESIVDTVLRGHESMWLSSPLGWRRDEVATTMAGDGEALALVPLVADDIVGVLAVSYPRIRIFAEDEQALLETVGVLAATALARGQRYDDEHKAALAFQHAALPSDLPTVEGLTIAARYRPATRHATVGGDWYDVLVLDERRVVLVVGDVVGHGMVAAAAMGRLRTAFQAIAPLSADPGAMLHALNHQVESIPDSFCTTVVCAVVDLATGTMTWSRAGHPPPLVLRGGVARLLDETGVPPLGVSPESPPPVHSCSLDRGDVVVLYTDGVIERRGESIDDGFERLGIVADDLSDLDPDEFSDALVEALVPAEGQADDLAVLVTRYNGCAAALTVERSEVPEPVPIRKAL